MRAARVAVPTLMTALVLIPDVMAGDANGSRTRISLANGGRPIASAASSSAAGICVSPVNVFLTMGSKL